MSKVVQLGVEMRPASRMAIEGVESSGAGLQMFLKILAMPPDERRRVVADQSQDELLVWFALLTPLDRREFLAAAGRDLKLRNAERLQQEEDEKKG